MAIQLKRDEWSQKKYEDQEKQETRLTLQWLSEQMSINPTIEESACR